jgi:hypothetical protein
MFTAEELEDCDILPKKITFGSCLKCGVYFLVMSMATILMYSFYSGRDFVSLVSFESMKYGSDSYYLEKLAKIDNRFDYNTTEKYSLNFETYLKNPKILIKEYVLKSLPAIIKNVSIISMIDNSKSFIPDEQEVQVEHRQDPNGFLHNEDIKITTMTYKKFKENSQDKNRTVNFYLNEAYIETIHEKSESVLINYFLNSIKRDLVLLPQGIKYTEGYDEFFSPGHYDASENIFCQLNGEIDMMIIPAMQRNSVYPFKKNYGPPNYSAVNFFKGEYGRFPNFRFSHRLYITLSKGDCIFLPAYWWFSIKTEINRHFSVLNFQFKTHSRWAQNIFKGLETEEF